MSDSYELIYDDLVEAYFAASGLRSKQSHARVAHVAHGWFMRVARSCAGVFALVEAGFGEEAWPLRRAALEHLIALLWLAERGNDARDVILRAHAEASRRRQESLVSAGWSSAELPVWELVRQDGEAATGNRSESRILTNFTARADEFGHVSDMAGWLIETNNSHPGWQTASRYVDASGESPRLLLEPRSEDGPDDADMCAGRTLRALSAVDFMLEGAPFEEVLREARERFSVLRGG